MNIILGQRYWIEGGRLPSLVIGDMKPIDFYKDKDGFYKIKLEKKTLRSLKRRIEMELDDEA